MSKHKTEHRRPVCLQYFFMCVILQPLDTFLMIPKSDLVLGPDLWCTLCGYIFGVSKIQGFHNFWSRVTICIQSVTKQHYQKIFQRLCNFHIFTTGSKGGSGSVTLDNAQNVIKVVRDADIIVQMFLRHHFILPFLITCKQKAIETWSLYSICVFNSF